jgi:hypothetical protein
LDGTLNVTDEQIRRELDAAMGLDIVDEDGDDVFTTSQLVEMYGLPWQTAARRAELAVRQGTMKVLHVMRPATDGSMRIMKAYRLAKK